MHIGNKRMESIGSEKEDNKRDNEAREFASAVLTGTVIGRSLQNALQSLRREDELEARSDDDATTGEGDGSCGDDEGDSKDPPVKEIFRKHLVTMDERSENRILKSFAEAVAESGLCHDPEKDGAPRALLRGRCEHFNRLGTNWVISIKEAKIKARPTKFTKRRRDDRPSLWDRDDDGTPRGDDGKPAEKEIALHEKIQLLAYGDTA